MASGQIQGGMKAKLTESVSSQSGGMTHSLKPMAGGVLPAITRFGTGKISTHKMKHGKGKKS